MAPSSLDLRSAAGILALQTIPRVGPATALRVALAEDVNAVGERRRIDPRGLERAYGEAQELIERWAEDDLSVLTFFDRQYPSRLRALHDAPPLLWVRGDTSVLSAERLVAVIGTRNPSTFGRSAAKTLTEAVCGDGWGVLSGLAVGCDTIAHDRAVALGAPTIAVMGGGLDDIYPAENRGLAETIVAQGGALVAEVPPGAAPSPGNLIRRDRLQSGLSVAVLLCQTEIKGGSMHTVRYAAEQGRPVFVPDPTGSNGKSEGLRVLLERPAEELCEALPAWRNSSRLCRRLGRNPLARTIARDELDCMLSDLNEALARQKSAQASDTLRPPGDLIAA